MSELYAAWNAARAALPEGWVIECGDYPNGECWAQAIGPEDARGTHRRFDSGRQPTLATALDALVLNLSDVRAVIDKTREPTP